MSKILTKPVLISSLISTFSTITNTNLNAGELHPPTPASPAPSNPTPPTTPPTLTTESTLAAAPLANRPELGAPVTPAPAKTGHQPEATFRVGVAKGPANQITTTLAPVNSGPSSMSSGAGRPTGSPNGTNKSNAPKSKLKNWITKKTKAASATPQDAPFAPSSLGAVVLMGGNNHVKNRSDEALVVLIPYDTDQLPVVSEFTKWLYEQQTVNLRKLADLIAKKSALIKLNNVKTVNISRTDLETYLNQTGHSFERAVDRFAEELGRYERILTQLQFSDLKAAAIAKLQETKRPVAGMSY